MRLLRKIISEFRLWLRDLAHRRRYGVSQYDNWNLDVALALWLGKRLRVHAETTCCCPAGYGGEMDSKSEMTRWRADLRKYASACLDYAKDPYDLGDSAQVRHLDYVAALRWVSTWVGHLWW